MRIATKKFIHRFPDSEEGQIEAVILSDLAATTTNALRLQEVACGIVEATIQVKKRQGYQDIQIDLMYGPAPYASQDRNVPWLRIVGFVEVSDLSSRLLEVPLDILELPTRVHLALCRAGIGSVGSLLAWMPKHLLEIRNIGLRSLMQIERQLSCIVGENLARSKPRPLPEPNLLVRLKEI